MQTMKTAPISQIMKPTVYDDCAELTREQFTAVFGNNSDADFCYWLICKTLIFARFSAAGMGIGLYVRRLIREYIQ